MGKDVNSQEDDIKGEPSWVEVNKTKNTPGQQTDIERAFWHNASSLHPFRVSGYSINIQNLLQGCTLGYHEMG